MFILQFLRSLIIKKKRGSPILEEILLIGIAIVIFAIIFGLIWGLIEWSQGQFTDFFNW